MKKIPKPKQTIKFRRMCYTCRKRLKPPTASYHANKLGHDIQADKRRKKKYSKNSQIDFEMYFIHCFFFKQFKYWKEYADHTRHGNKSINKGKICGRSYHLVKEIVEEENQ